jgi:ribonuclease-3
MTRAVSKKKNLPNTKKLFGYEFEDAALLDLALTHRSFSAKHNERLEFIGDSVLNCVVALNLYRHFPELPEGDLSRIRARLVDRDTLDGLAHGMNLARFLRLGEGELKSGDFERSSILADAMEAIFGAIATDANFDAARAAIEFAYGDKLKNANPEQLGKDPKTRLQEWLQGRHIPLPDYKVTEIKGEAHEQIFRVECAIALFDSPVQGEGFSRRAAEQRAAAVALEQLSALPPKIANAMKKNARRRLKDKA